MDFGIKAWLREHFPINNYHYHQGYITSNRHVRSSLPYVLAVCGVHHTIHKVVDGMHDQWNAGQAHQCGHCLEEDNWSPSHRKAGSPGYPSERIKT